MPEGMSTATTLASGKSLIDRADRLQHAAGGRTVDAGAEQRIHDDRCGAHPRRNLVRERTTASLEHAQILRRVALHFLGLRVQHHVERGRVDIV